MREQVELLAGKQRKAFQESVEKLFSVLGAFQRKMNQVCKMNHISKRRI